MRQPSRIDWSFAHLWVLVLAAVVFTLVCIYDHYSKPKPKPANLDLTEVIHHAIRMENDLVDLERRIERLEVGDATGTEE